MFSTHGCQGQGSFFFFFSFDSFSWGGGWTLIIHMLNILVQWCKMLLDLIMTIVTFHSYVWMVAEPWLFSSVEGTRPWRTKLEWAVMSCFCAENVLIYLCISNLPVVFWRKAIDLYMFLLLHTHTYLLFKPCSANILINVSQSVFLLLQSNFWKPTMLYVLIHIACLPISFLSYFVPFRYFSGKDVMADFKFFLNNVKTSVS